MVRNLREPLTAWLLGFAFGIMKKDRRSTVIVPRIRGKFRLRLSGRCMDLTSYDLHGILMHGWFGSSKLAQRSVAIHARQDGSGDGREPVAGRRVPRPCASRSFRNCGTGRLSRSRYTVWRLSSGTVAHLLTYAGLHNKTSRIAEFLGNVLLKHPDPVRGYGRARL